MINRIQHFRRIVRIWNVLGHSIWTFVDVVRFALSKRENLKRTDSLKTKLKIINKIIDAIFIVQFHNRMCHGSGCNLCH